MPSARLFWSIVYVTAIECAGVFAWLYYEHAGRHQTALVLLVLGETLESGLLFAIALFGPSNKIKRPGEGATLAAKERYSRYTRHLLLVRIGTCLAVPIEIVIWLTWLGLVRREGYGVSSLYLLVVMHLKHQMEAAAVRGTSYFSQVFERSGTIASVCEVAGAVLALALVRGDIADLGPQPVLGALALVTGIGIEHVIFIKALQTEMAERDICLPRGFADARVGTRGWAWEINGVQNQLVLVGASHLRLLWEAVRAIPPLAFAMNRYIINQFGYRMTTRPDALSTMASYTTWESLTDRTYSARHLPPKPALYANPPRLDVVTELFRRDENPSRDKLKDQESKKSTLLFPFFAQWFVDGFLRTDPKNPLKNTSTHEIDLSQLYGQTRRVTEMLRTGCCGLLRSQCIEGRKGEYPPDYLDARGYVKREFRRLPLVYGDRKGPRARDRGLLTVGVPREVRDREPFAVGIPRGNIHYGFQMMSTVFLREHNRLARLIGAEHAGDASWDDERIFQTARNTLTVILLKIVVEDYINHITPFNFKLFLQPGTGARERWYRQNWMAIEFDLLYRWHALVPTRVTVAGAKRPIAELEWDTGIVRSNSLLSLFEEASEQPCTEIGLFNTPAFLLDVERRTIEIEREADLASYNDYREACAYPRLNAFAEISKKTEVVEALSQRYPSIDDVEFYVGLFAEDVPPKAALPRLMGTMVGVDAFTQALTNPLLAKGVFGPQVFSESGEAEFWGTTSLAQIVRRNCGVEASKPITFTRVKSRGKRGPATLEPGASG
jgi:prostaglandin-endoperoxide synthase 2